MSATAGAILLLAFGTLLGPAARGQGHASLFTLLPQLSGSQAGAYAIANQATDPVPFDQLDQQSDANPFGAGAAARATRTGQASAGASDAFASASLSAKPESVSVQLSLGANASASRGSLASLARANGNTVWSIRFVAQTNLLLTAGVGVTGRGTFEVNRWTGITRQSLLWVREAALSTVAIPPPSPSGSYTLALEAGSTFEVLATADAAATADSPGTAPDIGAEVSTLNASLSLEAVTRPRLAAIEVVQSIQDWKNSVPLVTGKRTFARVFLESPDPDGVGQRFTGRLIGRRGATELAGSPLSPLGGAGLQNPAAFPGSAHEARSNDVSNLGASLTFELPPDWCRESLCLRFELEGQSYEPIEPAEAGGTAADGVVCVSFQGVARPRVFARPLGLRTDRPPARALPSIPEIARLIQFTRHMYPVDDVEWQIGSEIYCDRRPDSVTRSDLLSTVQAARAADSHPELNGFYLGVTSRQIFGSGNPDRTSQGLSAMEASSGWAKSYPETTAAHELGHLLHQGHAVHAHFGRTPDNALRGSCGEEEHEFTSDFPFFDLSDAPSPTSKKPLLGPLSTDPNDWIHGFTRFDGAYTVKMLTNSFELMGYCEQTNEAWISSHTYAAIRTQLNAGNPPGAASPAGFTPAGSPVPPTSTLLVRGTFSYQPAAVAWRPLLVRPGGPPPATPPPGPFTLRLLDAQGAALHEHSIALPRLADAPGIGVSEFLVEFPHDDRARRVELRRNAELIGAADASPAQPAVQVIAPAVGSVIQEPAFTVQWEATDTDGDPLTYLVQASRDDGVTWNTLAVDVSETRLDLTTEDLPGGGALRIRVLASDGFHCVSSAPHGPFTVPDKAPVVVMEDPADGTSFAADEPVVMAGLAFDREEGRVPSTQLEWHSDRDGLLGTGTSLQRKASTLSPGAHELRLVARDRVGQIGSVTNRIVIQPFLRPHLRILSRDESSVRVEIFGHPGTLSQIEASSNLVDWAAQEDLLQGSRLMRVDLKRIPGASEQFLRIRTLPLPPKIPQPPASQSLLTGGSITLNAGAADRLNHYQWYRDGIAIPEATSSSLSLSNAQPSQSGSYVLVVSNASGSVSSAPALVTVMSANYEVLHWFGTNALDGINGWGPLIRASDGAIYGCSRGGAISNGGVLFRIQPDGSGYTVLHRFTPATDGGGPSGGVLEGSDGQLYGTCSFGGANNSGTIWAIDPQGVGFRVLRHFLSTGDCRTPLGPLIEDADGRLCGTGSAGGGLGRGGVFRVTKDGSDYRILTGFNFGGAAFPSQPLGGLVEAEDGRLYGVTELGGTANRGAFYSLAKEGTNPLLLASFGGSAGAPANPEGGLLKAKEPFTFYGTTYSGGASNRGAIYRLTTLGGTIATLASVGTSTGAPAEPRSPLTYLPSGRIAGTSRIGGTANQGTVFDLSNSGADLQVRHSLGTLPADGARSRSPLLSVPGGVVYGTTFGGGTNDQGVIFRLRLP